MCLGLVGCGCSSKDDAKLTDDKRVAITVDGNDVYLDEAKFYTYQGAVKGRVSDDMCQTECFFAKKDEYNVKLDADEKKKIDIDVENYFSEHTDGDNHYDKLQKKIGITKKRLKEVLTKEAIAQKVQDIMEAEKKGSAGKYYKDWIDDVSINCRKCWSDINFNEHIFSKKDIENESDLATEVPDETDEDVMLESAE